MRLHTFCLFCCTAFFISSSSFADSSASRLVVSPAFDEFCRGMGGHCGQQGERCIDNHPQPEAPQHAVRTADTFCWKEFSLSCLYAWISLSASAFACFSRSLLAAGQACESIGQEDRNT